MTKQELEQLEKEFEFFTDMTKEQYLEFLELADELDLEYVKSEILKQ